MENKTGFNLNAAVESWRAHLAAHETIGAEQLRELESHLREAVAGFRAKGLTEEEAFLLAARRIGPGEKVAEEYHNEDPNALIRTRVFWMLMGVAGILFVAEASRVLVTMTSIVTAFLMSPDEFYLWDTMTWESMGGDWVRDQRIFIEVPVVAQLYGAIGLSGVLYFWATRFFRRDGLRERRCRRVLNSRNRLGVTLGLMLVGTSLFSRLMETNWDQFLRYGLEYQFSLPRSAGYFVFLLLPILISALATMAAPKHLIANRSK